MMEMTIPVAEDGSMEITFVGDRASFAQAMPTEDNAYGIELLETGEHYPALEDVFASLTARQCGILDVAVRLGYYENPRESTHEDIAEAVEASASTVDEHLRKIESRIFAEFVREG